MINPNTMTRGIPILLLFLLSFSLQGQKSFLPFKHLTIDDGLSQNSINFMIQDQFGFLWIATQDGLNRYDGKQFITYRNERGNPNSLSSNYIWTLYEDSDGIIWIGTFGGGLNRFDPLRGDIKHYKTEPGSSESFPSDRVFTMLEYPTGTLWIGCNEGLIQFDKSTGKSELFLEKRTSEAELENNFVGTLAIDESKQLWLRTDAGLTRFNPETKEHTSFKQAPFSEKITLGDIHSIKNHDGELLVSCDAGLLSILPEEQKDSLLLSAQDPKFNGLSPTLAYSLSLGNQQYAIGSSKGLVLYNRKQETIHTFSQDPNDPVTLSHNNVISLFRSHDDILWIGTRNGLNLLEQLNPDFVHIRYREGKSGLSSKNVNSFMEENDSLMWVGTTNQLNLYDRKQHTFSVYKSGEGDAKNLQTDYVLCLFRDSKGNRWLGTRRDGLYRIDSKDKGFEINRVRPSNDPDYSVSIHFIEESQDGSLWLGTGGEGLWHYDPESNRIKKYPYNPDGSGPAHNYVFTVVEDSQQNVWLGTATGGLNLFNPVTERFKYFRHNPEEEGSLSENLILTLYESESGHLWIGSNGGLSKLKPKLKPNMFEALETDASVFQSFGQEDGFPNEVIYGMLEDPKNNLWLSTNRGLVVFSTESQEVVKTYDVSHGLQNNEFNQNGYYEDQKGSFFFGGINGFNRFQPEGIQGNIFAPKTVLTNFSLYNSKVKVGTENAVDGFKMDREIFGLDAISLKWKHDVLTFDYAGLSYQSPEKNQYKYRLLGFKEDWVNAGNRTSVTYTNLDPGDYTFEVLAANNSGVWSENPTRLNLHVGVPPWASWYAYLLYGLLILSGIYILVRYRTRLATQKIRIQAEIEKARVQEREEFRKRSSRDFHDEAGTKITRIALVTELLKTNLEPGSERMEYIDQIEENLQQLNAGMRDFIWALDPEKDNFHDTILRFTTFASPLCEYAQIDFKSNTLPEDLKSVELNMAQRRHLLLILKEGLHNAIKHASPTEIRFRVQTQANHLDIILEDNGQGFDPKAINSNGNGLRNMKERAEAAGIKLESHSEKGTGTSIQLRLQTTRMGN